MEDYIKTGEDKKYEYYRNDSEVLSGDGEEEPYEEIINKRDEFNVKIGNEEITIKKPSLYKLMILSNSQPEEHILFSLYKTISNANSRDQIKTQQIVNENIKSNNPNNLESLRNSKAISFPHMKSPENENNNINNENNLDNEKNPKNEENDNNELKQNNKINGNNVIPEQNEKEKKSISINTNDPLSSQKIVISNNSNSNSNSNNSNLNENVINIPTNEGSDNEDVSFKKTNKNDNVLLVGLPPQALRAKWFYLLLCLVGIGYIVLFIVGLINEAVGFMFNIFCMCIIGVFLIFTGLFGFTKINNRIYDNTILQIFTSICLLFGILGVIIIAINVITERYLIVSLILGILSVLFSFLCIIWTLQLKRDEQSIKKKQMERLVEGKN